MSNASSSQASSFYIVGGTLPKNAHCYITRAADAQLLSSLRKGEFCYVLNTRQIGKSSLMVHTAQRLRDEGVLVALLDLTAIGQNITVEAWYDGLLTLLGEQLHLLDALEDFWEEHRHLGPMQRWMQALTQVVLKQREQPLCLFIDEIDSVRSLPFSTNEFFAGIRECYNRRAQDPLFERLAFCLLGVAAPADLISDPLISPFNIGKRIVLTDFTQEEAASLALGFGGGNAAAQKPVGGALERVLYWTGGHPYLTQRLCEELAQETTLPTPREVDAACEQLFLSKQAQRTDDNLTFVRNRLLHDEASRAAILDLYRLLLMGRKVEEDATDPRHTALLLAGIVRVQNGALVVRNRIYAAVFDLKWALAGMPAEEAQRQKAAYRRGVLRTATLFGSFVALIVALLGVAIWNTLHTLAAEKRAAHSLYISDINLIQREWESDNAPHVFELMNETRHSVDRGLEWDYWNRQCHQSLHTLVLTEPPPDVLPEKIMAVAIVPGRKQVTALGEYGSLKWWDIETGRLVRTLQLQQEFCAWLAYSPDGAEMLIGIGKSIQIRDSAQGTLLETLPDLSDPVLRLAFSPDGKQFVALTVDGSVSLWNTPARNQRTGHPRLALQDSHYFHMAFLQGQLALFRSDGTIEMRDRRTGQEIRRLSAGFSGGGAAFSQDGTRVAGQDRNGNVNVVDTTTGKSVVFLSSAGNIHDLYFSADDRTIIAGQGGAVKVWEARTGTSLHTFSEHLDTVMCLACTGRYVVSCARDSQAKVWDLDTPSNPLRAPLGRKSLWWVAYSPNGKLLVTTSTDGKATIWDVPANRILRTIQASTVRVTPALFSPDSALLYTGDNLGVVSVWSVETGQLVRRFGSGAPINSAVFSPDGRLLYTASDDHTATEWEVATGTPRHHYGGHTKPVEALAMTHDGKRLITGGDDFRTNIWDVRNDTKPLLPPFVGPAETWGVAVSPNDRFLAVGNLRRTVQVWDMFSQEMMEPSPEDKNRRKEPLYTLSGHSDWVIQIAFSPDGRRLATTSRDGTARIWEMETGREVLSLKGHQGQVTSVAFSPDGYHIATVGKDGDLMIWDTTPLPAKISLRDAQVSP